MKKLYYLLLIVVLSLNCGKEEPSLLEMAYRGNFSIPAGLNPFETHFFVIPNIPNNKDPLFNASGLTDADVEMILPRRARINSIFNGPSFDFAEEVFVRIYTDDEYDYLEVFWRQPVPENTGSNLDLIAGLGNTQRFFTASTFNIIIGFRNLRYVLPQTIDAEIDFSFDVK